MRDQQAINYNWKYKKKFSEEYIQLDYNDSDFDIVNIPHTNKELPYNNFDEKSYQFESCYRKNLEITDLDKSKRIFICFEAVMTYAKVFCNGQPVGEHKGGYTPFECDITDELKVGNNVIAVYVDSRERDEIPPFGHVIDYLTYGGIYREVHLEYRSSQYIDFCHIEPLNVLTESPKINVKLGISNRFKNSDNYKLNFTLKLDNKIFHQFESISKLNGDPLETLQFTEEVKGVSLWQLDDPTLYTLDVDLIIDEEIKDHIVERFGFREIQFDQTGFYLNGELIKLRGLNRHQSYPYVGYAMPKSAQEKDAELLKYDLGVNVVRSSHYPQSRHFLNRCDEIGLLVFDEIPGWQHLGSGEWKEITLQHTEEMIKTNFNHPSIFIWGVRINESQDDNDLYAKTNKLAHSLDSTRPTGGVRYLQKSNLLEDVYTYNDFLHRGDNPPVSKKRKVTKSKKGYLITEHNGHMFPTKKYDNESKRLEQALRHLRVINASSGDKHIAGAIGWCMFDYNTHKDFGSGDRICYHGVMDMFRIPKHAAATYSSQQNDEPYMYVASPMLIGEYSASIMDDIHVFTNCDYVKLHRNGEFIGNYYPDDQTYKYVEHPPIVIKDLIGNLIEKNERFSVVDAQIIKNLLLKASKTGGKLGPIDLVKMGYLFIKYKMKYSEAEGLFTKYLGGWGGEAVSYAFEGMLNEKAICKVVKSQTSTPKLAVTIDSDKLIESETYDVTRVVVKAIDDEGNDLIYASDAFTINVEGPIEIIGPKTLSLIGGSIGFWIKSTGVSGEARIRINSERFGIQEKEVEIVKE